MEAMSHFSNSTGLVANIEKSNLFMAGVDASTKEKLLNMTGFSEGSFPIRYLGLPLSPKKWSKIECHQLCLKITEKIRAVSTRHLSYAGRLLIINRLIFFA